MKLSVSDIGFLSIDIIKKKINSYDNNIWLNNMQNKSTLQLYRQHKKEVAEENWFRNGYKYSLMMECRGTSLNLN